MNPSILSKVVRVPLDCGGDYASPRERGQRRPGTVRHRQHQRTGCRFQRSDAARAGRWQHRHDTRAAAADRLPVRRESLERDPRQHRADSHPRAVRGARRQRSWQRRADRTSAGLHQRPAGRDVVSRRAGQQAGGIRSVYGRGYGGARHRSGFQRRHHRQLQRRLRLLPRAGQQPRREERSRRRTAP